MRLYIKGAGVNVCAHGGQIVDLRGQRTTDIHLAAQMADMLTGRTAITIIRTYLVAALYGIEAGTADVILEIPRDFEKDWINGKAPRLLVAANAVNGTKGSLGGSYLSSIISDYSRELMSEAPVKAPRQPRREAQANTEQRGERKPQGKRPQGDRPQNNHKKPQAAKPQENKIGGLGALLLQAGIKGSK